MKLLLVPLALITLLSGCVVVPHHAYESRQSSVTGYYSTGHPTVYQSHTTVYSRPAAVYVSPAPVVVTAPAPVTVRPAPVYVRPSPFPDASLNIRHGRKFEHGQHPGHPFGRHKHKDD